MAGRMLLAGFGGQGILFAGKLFTYAGMLEGKNVTNIPEYGPEMRGGTCNCSVIIDEEPIGSPLVLEPDILIAMNLPSLDRFEKTAAPGAKIFVDSTLIGRKVLRDDVEAFYIPATGLASDAGIPKLANVIIVGKVIRESKVCDWEGIEDALKKVVSARHADLLGANLKALEMGYNFEG